MTGITPAQLAREPYFCGVTAKWVDDISFLAWFRGYRYHPSAICSHAHNQLKIQLEFFRTSKTEDISGVEESLSSTLNLKAKKAIIDKAVERKDRQREQVTGDTNRKWRDYDRNGALYCPQAPKHSKSGMKS